MKKLLISLSVITLLLLSGTYFVGEMVAKETQAIFAKNQAQGFTIRLLNYDKHFLKATAHSELAISVEGSVPLVINVRSAITHYPWKASIENTISFADPNIAQQIQKYFDSDNGINSQEEINLLGELTGQLNILAGRYSRDNEQFFTEPLQLNYQVALRDSSGMFALNWQGLKAQTSGGDFSVAAVQVGANFNLQSVQHEYDYVIEIGEILSQQEDAKTQIQGIALQGRSGLGEQVDSIDSSNEWEIDSYQIGGTAGKQFSKNYIKMDIKGLHAPALAILNSAADDRQQVEQALSALLEHGAQLSIPQLSSQTPWGEANGHLTVTLQQGAVFSEILSNPFMLLDYIAGNAHLSLPVALLDEAKFGESLTMAVMTGFLKQQEQKLILDTQFEQGELTVNGRVIPL